MTKRSSFVYNFDAPATYKIRVQGSLQPHWSERLEGMTINVAERNDAPPETTLEGELLDQAALSGVLNLLYDLHLPVLSVKRIVNKPE
jgi:hypothetical protein